MLFTQPKYRKMLGGFLEKLEMDQDSLLTSVAARYIYLGIFNGPIVGVDCNVENSYNCLIKKTRKAINYK